MQPEKIKILTRLMHYMLLQLHLLLDPEIILTITTPDCIEVQLHFDDLAE